MTTLYLFDILIKTMADSQLKIKLLFKKCDFNTDKKILHSVINYLQSTINDNSSSWCYLDAIFNGCRNGQLYVVIDTNNNIYGYLLGYNTNLYMPIQIQIMEVITSYRRKGVGTFMISQWEKIYYDSITSKDDWNGQCVAYVVKDSIHFWSKMGYTKSDDPLCYKKQLKNPYNILNSKCNIVD